jgi:hypothetical protein
VASSAPTLHWFQGRLDTCKPYFSLLLTTELVPL